MFFIPEIIIIQITHLTCYIIEIRKFIYNVIYYIKLCAFTLYK